MSRGKANRTSGGFTLIEALISFTLLVMIMVLLANIQHTAKLQLERTRRPEALAVQLSRAVDRFILDCRHFQVPGFLMPGDPVMDLEQTGGASSNARIGFYVAEYAPAGLQEIRAITYLLEGSDLVRYSRRATQDNAAYVHGDRREALVSNVSSLQCWVAAGPTAWLSPGQWAQTGRKGVPQGLKLAFTTGDGVLQCWAKLFSGDLLTTGGCSCP